MIKLEGEISWQELKKFAKKYMEEQVAKMPPYKDSGDPDIDAVLSANRGSLTDFDIENILFTIICERHLAQLKPMTQGELMEKLQKEGYINIFTFEESWHYKVQVFQVSAN